MEAGFTSGTVPWNGCPPSGANDQDFDCGGFFADALLNAGVVLPETGPLLADSVREAVLREEERLMAEPSVVRRREWLQS
ncbi:MAG: hypothetical protein ACKOFW_19150, partial [Planctomycetaceae bacterium]